MPPSFRRLGAPFPIFTALASTGRIEGPRPFQSQRIKMFDIIELNGKKVAELREIATKLGIARVDKLKSRIWSTAFLMSKPPVPTPKDLLRNQKAQASLRDECPEPKKQQLKSYFGRFKSQSRGQSLVQNAL